jgi:outer membrane protein assembly factor BamB
VWKQPCGGGYAAFAVAGNVAVTIEQRRGDEVVVCYDRATGKERWTYAYPALFRDLTGNGPRATPTIANGEVYSLGAKGDLLCLKGKTGELKWATNILEDCGAEVVTWGMSSSPLVVGDLVVVNAGVGAKDRKRALAAYDRNDGTLVWAKGDQPAGYSSPMLATLCGVRQVLLFDAGGLAGFDLLTGKELWRHPWKTYQDMNIIQPVVLPGDRVFLSSETSNGCAVLQVTKAGKKFAVEPVWANNRMGAKYANPVHLDGFIYGLSGGLLVCLDAETGERRWRGKSYGHGQLLAVAEHLVVLSERGFLALVDASPEGFRERGRLEVFGDKTWNTPALAGGRLYLRNHVEMACVEVEIFQPGK